MLTPELMHAVRRLQIRAQRRVDGLFAGEYQSAYKGRGIEFDEVRTYAPGDDVRSIDWNVTARAGEPFIKRFIEERHLTVMLLVDLSASEDFGSTRGLKRKLAQEVAAVLALAATRASDRVGLTICTDRVETFVPPRSGRTHALRILRDLIDFEPVGRGTSLAPALRHLDRTMSKHAVVFVVSDFLDRIGATPVGATAGGATAGAPTPVPTTPGGAARGASGLGATAATGLGSDSRSATGTLAPTRHRDQDADAGFFAPLRRLAVRHDVTAVRLGDPHELALPAAGLLRVRDPEDGRIALVDTSSRRVRRRYAEAVARHRRETEHALRRARVDLVDVRTDGSFVDDLAAHLRRREQRR